MDTKEHQPLPVDGYTSQSDERVAIVNENKQHEERMLQRLDFLKEQPGVDQRWLAIGRMHIEQAFMATNRAVFQPQRVTLND